jgi:hypothetical protein
VESPRREASSPRILSNGAKIHTTTLWHFWRAPPRPLADPYQTGHGLPLEFLASSSSETVETSPSRVVRRSPPLLLSQRMHEGRTMKTGKILIDLTCARLGGLNAKS